MSPERSEAITLSHRLTDTDYLAVMKIAVDTKTNPPPPQVTADTTTYLGRVFGKIREYFYPSQNDTDSSDISFGHTEVRDGCKASFLTVIEAIASEVKHIERIGYTNPTSTAEYILLMQHYLFHARDDRCCSKKPLLDELDNIRKVTTLGVLCLEEHGAPCRVKSKANPIPGQPDTHERR
jgi:hypothetical protein